MTGAMINDTDYGLTLDGRDTTLVLLTNIVSFDIETDIIIETITA